MPKLNQLLEELQGVERAERQMQKVQQQLDFSYRQLEHLAKALDKEYADVEKLEKMSIKGVFYKVLGDKEAQLEKERQDYLQAVLKYDEYKKSVELLEFEKGVLSAKIKKGPELKKKKQQYINEREQQLIASNSAVGKELVIIDRDIQEKFYLKREIHEALLMGAKAVDMLSQMIESLEAARNWGRYDMAGGKGMSSHMKHSNIDNARALAYKLKHILIKFEDELYDVYDREQFEISFKLDSFTHFTDIFFDNLITDWIVQQKIRNALANVFNVQDRVSRIVGTLKHELKSMDDGITYLEKKKKNLILTSG